MNKQLFTLLLFCIYSSLTFAHDQPFDESSEIITSTEGPEDCLKKLIKLQSSRTSYGERMENTEVDSNSIRLNTYNYAATDTEGGRVFIGKINAYIMSATRETRTVWSCMLNQTPSYMPRTVFLSKRIQ